jgi:hypothetical protein
LGEAQGLASELESALQILVIEDALEDGLAKLNGDILVLIRIRWVA